MPHQCLAPRFPIPKNRNCLPDPRRCSANVTGRLVHIGNKTYAACDTIQDCADMNGGRLVNECQTRSLPNGTGATARVQLCSCMQLAGFLPRGDEGPCWEARCNVGPKTCLTRHAEGYFNLVSVSVRVGFLRVLSSVLPHMYLLIASSHSNPPTHILMPASLSITVHYLGPAPCTAALHDAPRSVFRPARCDHIVQKRRLQPVSNNNYMYHTVAMFGDHRERWVESVEDHRGRRPSPGRQGRHCGRILRTRLHDFVDSIGCEHASHVASGTF